MIFRASGKKPKVEVSVHKATAEELAEHRSFTERSERLMGDAGRADAEVSRQAGCVDRERGVPGG